jgi:putative oligomerization/nucleic acid binding protein
MFVRRRPLLRAAVVGGGAYMAGKHMANKANDQAAYEAQQDDRISSLEQQQGQGQYAPPQQAPPPTAPSGGSSVADQLQQIATLHQQGVLNDDEFAAAKAKILGGG